MTPVTVKIRAEEPGFGIIEFKSLFGNQFSNKLQVGYTHFNDFRNAASDPFPVLNINSAGNRYIVAGHEPFSINNKLKQTVLQISDNFNIYMGDHTITIGGSFEKFEFDNSFNLGVNEPFPDPNPANPLFRGNFWTWICQCS